MELFHQGIKVISKILVLQLGFSLSLFYIFCITVVEKSVSIYFGNCLQLKYVEQNGLKRFWQFAYFSWNYLSLGFWHIGLKRV